MRNVQIIDEEAVYLGVEVYTGTGSLEEIFKYLEVASFDADRAVGCHTNSAHQSVYFIRVLFSIIQINCQRGKKI